ncbi:MAG TPA: HAD family hydrolase [Armatimonadota bacterium]|jgi:HAD superfamily hydrolase (TIGR01549 family)
MPVGKPVKWAFFDIGDTLFDETPPHLLLFHSLLQTLNAYGHRVRWDDFNARRIAEVREERGDLSGTIRSAFDAFCDGPAEAEALWREGHALYESIRAPRPYGVLMDGMQPLLERLTPRVRLGVVANQHSACRRALSEYGLDNALSVIVISELAGIEKPDPAIYRLALELAGCAGDAAVFVGDRPDHDVAAPKAEGMRTIRVRFGCHWVHAEPRTREEEPDETVTTIADLESALNALTESR